MDNNSTQFLQQSVETTQPGEQSASMRHQAALAFIRQFARAYYPSPVSTISSAEGFVLN